MSLVVLQNRLSKKRLKNNPLRILDSKNPSLRGLISESPKITSFLGRASKNHIDNLCEMLDELNLPFKTNHNLVRGLDYYNLTVFEWKHEILGAQSTVCGGGRYDNLSELVGGKPTPAFGFAVGMERLIDLIQEENALSVQSDLDLYIVHMGEQAKRKALIFAENIREIGLKIKVELTDATIKTQMKRAGLSGASFVAIFGDSELELGCVTIRSLNLDFNQNRLSQKSVPLESVADFLLDSLNNTEKNICEKI